MKVRMLVSAVAAMALAGAGMAHAEGSSGSAGPLAPLLAPLDSLGTVLGGSSALNSQPGTPLPGRWAGTWTVSGTSYPATLVVNQGNTLTGHLSIPSRPCEADWTEVGRTGNEITVRVNVTSGHCVNNTWSFSGKTTTIYDDDNGTVIALTRVG